MRRVLNTLIVAACCFVATPAWATRIDTVPSRVNEANQLATNPVDCTANLYAHTIGVDGGLTCSQVTLGQLGATCTDGQVVGGNVGATGLECQTDDDVPEAGDIVAGALPADGYAATYINASGDTYSGIHDLGGAISELPNATARTATDCDVAGEAGRVTIDTDAASGQQLYTCEGATGWVRQGRLLMQRDNVGTARCDTVDVGPEFTLSDTDDGIDNHECDLGIGSTIMTTQTNVSTSQLPLTLANDDQKRCWGTSGLTDLCIWFDGVADAGRISGAPQFTEGAGIASAQTFDVSVGNLILPQSVTSATGLGRANYDSDGGTSNMKQVTVGDGTNPLPLRTCWDVAITGNQGANSTAFFAFGKTSLNAAQTGSMAWLVDTTLTGLRCNQAEDLVNGQTNTYTIATAAASSYAPFAGTDGGGLVATFSDSLLSQAIVGAATGTQFQTAIDTDTVVLPKTSLAILRVIAASVCVGGTNAGAACTVASQCPSGACNSMAFNFTCTLLACADTVW